MVKVIESGFFTTIQDLGRKDYQQYGVPYSGVMDIYSALMANALLNNNENDALLEITMSGPKLQFTHDAFICITGAHIDPKLNSTAIIQNHIVKVVDGDILSFGKLVLGFRAYLAVSGGFQTEVVMNSRSMYNNITNHVKISNGDELQTDKPSIIVEQTHSSIKVNNNHFTSKEIEVFKGPEFELLSAKQKKLLFTKDFTISKYNNRMAYQLDEIIENNLNSIITSLVLPGTIQLTPSGMLIILMRDCQTTGGYPRVLQLKDSSINCLAQKFTGNSIRLVLIE